MLQFDYCNIFQMGWSHQLEWVLTHLLTIDLNFRPGTSK